jgi:EF hand
MNRTALAILVGTVAMTGYAAAGETRTVTRVVEDKQIVTCTTDGKGPVVCETKQGEAAGAPAPGGGDRRVVVITDDNEGHADGDDVNVQVLEDGKGTDKRVIVIRRAMHDNADANKDGMITRREFIAGAEKRFAEMDKNKDGVLSKEEAMPPMPPMPPIEGLPPLPPLAPLPPAPPAPPAPPSR